MLRTREEVRRWVVFPLFVAAISATSVLAEVKISHLQWADGTDHLFRNVADRGPDARPRNGTVTETASQARTTDRAEEAVLVASASSGTVTETVVERPMQAPEVRPIRVAVASRVLPARPLASRELRRLREENRALKGIVSDLCAEADATRFLHETTARRPTSAALVSAVAPAPR